MIDKALFFIEEKLNSYFRNRLDEDKVVLSNMIGPDGHMELQEQNKIIFSLIGIEKETIAKSQEFYRKSSSGDSLHRNPPLYLNLYVIFAAYFSSNNYKESLKTISMVISFFQSNNVFTAQKSPEMDSGLEMLVFDMLEQNQHDRTHMWSMIGGKYMPSVVYKVRMLTFASDAAEKVVPSINNSVNKTSRN
jgi:hypothetical protein